MMPHLVLLLVALSHIPARTAAEGVPTGLLRALASRKNSAHTTARDDLSATKARKLSERKLSGRKLSAAEEEEHRKNCAFVWFQAGVVTSDPVALGTASYCDGYLPFSVENADHCCRRRDMPPECDVRVPS